MERCLHFARAINHVTNGKREEPPKPSRANQELFIHKSREGRDPTKEGRDPTKEGITNTIFVIMGGEDEIKESKKMTHVVGTLSFS